MKKSIVTLLTLVFSAVWLLPVFCAGGKEQGDNGVGTVDQGEIGSNTGNASGADAQGNQA